MKRSIRDFFRRTDSALCPPLHDRQQAAAFGELHQEAEDLHRNDFIQAVLLITFRRPEQATSQHCREMLRNNYLEFLDLRDFS